MEENPPTLCLLIAIHEMHLLACPNKYACETRACLVHVWVQRAENSQQPQQLALNRRRRALSEHAQKYSQQLRVVDVWCNHHPSAFADLGRQEDLSTAIIPQTIAATWSCIRRSYLDRNRTTDDTRIDFAPSWRHKLQGSMPFNFGML